MADLNEDYTGQGPEDLRTQYPESEKLSRENSEWHTLNDFLEFLGSKGVQLHVWFEGEIEEPCIGTLFHPCEDGKRDDGRTCTKCGGTRRMTIHHEGWTGPQGGTMPLVYEYLGVDPVKLEAERRDMLAKLQ